MTVLWIVLGVLGGWLALAVVLALFVGRAAHIGEVKYRDEVFLRDIASEPARLARDLNDGVIRELELIRSESAVLPAPAGERIRAAAERGLDEARAAVAALTRLG